MSGFRDFLNKTLDVVTDIYSAKQEIDKMAHCKPLYLGEASWSNNIYHGSNDNVVRLTTGDTVIANDGDCIKYLFDNYRWNGKQWEKLG